MNRLARAFLKRLQQRIIFGTEGPYLTKYRLFTSGKNRVRVYLHQFHRSDEDEELHSHPWSWSFSIILKGGYIETREDGDRTFWPGMFNFIRRTDFHRVELLEDEAWTLFVAGPEVDNWFFLDTETQKMTDWKTFVRAKGLSAD